MGKHYIPQRYLERFQIPDRPGHIWLYDLKRGNQTRCASIAKVAQQRDYFDEDVEKALAKDVERPSNQIVRRMLDGALPSEPERLQLSLYIGTMLKRVPHHRAKALRAVPEVLDDVITEIKGIIATTAPDRRFTAEKVASLTAEADRIEREYQEQLPPAVFQEIVRPWPGTAIVEVVHRMAWWLLVARTDLRFLTCDNPAYFFEGLGLNNPDAELVLPLSSTHALHCSWQETTSTVEVVDVGDQVTIELNRRLISGATRFVFFHENSEWISQLRGGLVYRLNRIHWSR